MGYSAVPIFRSGVLCAISREGETASLVLLCAFAVHSCKDIQCPPSAVDRKPSLLQSHNLSALRGILTCLWDGGARRVWCFIPGSSGSANLASLYKCLGVPGSWPFRVRRFNDPGTSVSLGRGLRGARDLPDFWTGRVGLGNRSAVRALVDKASQAGRFRGPLPLRRVRHSAARRGVCSKW